MWVTAITESFVKFCHNGKYTLVTSYKLEIAT
jgi:hypothetical protein